MPEVGPLSFTPTATGIRWTGDTMVIDLFLKKHGGDDTAYGVIGTNLHVDLTAHETIMIPDGYWLVYFLGSFIALSHEEFQRVYPLSIPVTLIVPT